MCLVSIYFHCVPMKETVSPFPGSKIPTRSSHRAGPLLRSWGEAHSPDLVDPSLSFPWQQWLAQEKACDLNVANQI